MGDVLKDLVDYIDRRLATMERAPGSWGSAESLELQALLLLELRTFALRPRTYAKNPFEARNAYLRFVRRRFPDAPASLLSGALPADRLEEELPGLVAELRKEVTGKLVAEDPFATSALAVELQFRAGSRGSFRTAASYFRQLARAVERLALPREPEEETRVLSWPMPELRAGTAPDGSALVWLLFEEPRWKKATRQRFFGALAGCLGIVEWAREASEPARDAARRLSADATKDRRLAEAALGLYPRGKVAAARIGGVAVGRAPVLIERGHASRLQTWLRKATVARVSGVPAAWSEGARPLPARPPRLGFAMEAA